MFKRKKEYGFTLVELLAVVAILSLLIGIVVYVAINVINNSREKTYRVTINNIEEVADDYLMENQDRLFYVSKTDDDNLEYQCVTVQDLIENGYFKNDLFESKVKDDKNVEMNDYVYIERNKSTKTVTKMKYLVDEDVTMCDKAVKAMSNVDIMITPIGWSSYKDITIRYKVKNYFNINDYTYHYSYNKNDVLSVISDNGNEKILRVTDNGIITGFVKDKDGNILDFGNSREITGIDKESPVIVAKDIIKIYGSEFDLYEDVTISDNSGIEVTRNVYYNGSEINSSKELALGDNVLYYVAEDKFGNISKTVARIIKIVVPDKEFDYLEEDQIYPVEADGVYIIEAYGAQGGNSGGLGGYVKAEVQLTTGDKLIINTGGINGYNGGGGYLDTRFNPGGGATTVKYNDEFIVVAGGGGATGNSGTGGDGGTGDGSGGIQVGNGMAGIAGTNGGGGSSSTDGKESYNCTEGKECVMWQWRSCPSGYQYYCGACASCCNAGGVCRSNSMYCSSYKTYTQCDTRDVYGKSGNGGSNSVNSPALSLESNIGNRENNGYVKVSYKLDD